MSQVPVGVLKKDQVRLGGTRVLGNLAPGAAPLAADAAQAPPAQARIVQQTPTAVVVEVTCECGRKILLQCDYR